MQRACILSCALLASNASFAGGFALIEQGASGLGHSYAGAAAVSDDASTIWFNPAGMTELATKQMLVAGHVIAVTSEFTDRGTTLNEAFGVGFVDPDFADSGSAAPVDAAGTSFIPNFYYVQPMGNGMTWGVGFSVPYGNSTDYDPTWVGRYQAVESAVTAIDINPSLAYRVNETFSIGGGLSIQSMTAELGSRVDSAGTCLGLVSRGTLQLAECLGAGLTTPGVAANDGIADVEGDGVAVSFNVGVLYKPRTGTKLGLSYRHGIDHELDGTGTFTNNENLQALLESKQIPLFVDGPVTAEASLPPTLMMSAAHEVSDQLQLLADATFTGWSSFDELRIVFDNPAQPDSFNTLAYEDSWRVSAGLNYKYNDALTLRAGMAYDEDPVPSPQLRTPRIPGNDRTWVSAGLAYKFNSKVGVDVGFAHLMMDETPLDNASEAAGGTTLRGVFEPSANILSAQVTVQFD